MKKHNCESDEF
jgi:N-acetyltransferase 10